jgi:hypothetical protein
MKKLIPFTLERWQKGNCTPKTADGREVKDFCYQPNHFYHHPLCGIVNGGRQTWKIDGIYYGGKFDHSKLMLEVDCEVVYVSIMRCDYGALFSEVQTLEHCYITHPNFIKEIKVEL